MKMQTQTQTLGVNPPLVVQIAASIMYTSLVRYYELDIHLSFVWTFNPSFYFDLYK